MGNFLNKLFGKTEDLYDDYDDERYDDDDYGPTLQDDRVEDLPRGSSSRSDRPRRAQDRTVAFPGSRQPQKTGHEVILSDATSIDDAWSICDHVKAGRTVICNTERLTPEIRTRFKMSFQVLLMPSAVYYKRSPNSSSFCAVQRDHSIR